MEDSGAQHDLPCVPVAPAPFIWPPRPAIEPAPVLPPATPVGDGAPLPTPRARRLAALLRDTWIDVERTWLDPVAEPLARRAAACGWRPDAPADYCPRCGLTVGPFETAEFGCAGCQGRRLPWSRFIRLGAYETPLSDWIQEVKFGRFRRLGLDLGVRLGEEVGAAAASPGPSRPWLIVPVASSWRRRVSRGIDHAAIIATGVSAGLEGGRVVQVLGRRHRPSQRSVAPSRRGTNVSGAFRIRRGVKLGGVRVLLVDDVATTGATLRSASRVLRRAGAEEVWVAVVGVAAPS